MTNEEAISVLEESKRQNEIMRDNPNTFFKVSDIVTGEKNAQKRIDALNMAISALRQQECVGDVNKSLTMDELSERNAPVFLPIKDFPNGGYWCLCENGYIIPPSGHGFMAKERPNWVFYSQKPEEDDHDERKENENV